MNNGDNDNGGNTRKDIIVNDTVELFKRPKN